MLSIKIISEILKEAEIEKINADILLIRELKEQVNILSKLVIGVSCLLLLSVMALAIIAL